MASEKFEFAQQVMNYCTDIIHAHIEGYDAREVFNDRGYSPSGGDPITNADVAGLEITATDVTNAMVFFENFQKMLDNLQVTVADYRKSLNMMRTDK